VEYRTPPPVVYGKPPPRPSPFATPGPHRSSASVSRRHAAPAPLIGQPDELVTVGHAEIARRGIVTGQALGHAAKVGEVVRPQAFGGRALVSPCHASRIGRCAATGWF